MYIGYVNSLISFLKNKKLLTYLSYISLYKYITDTYFKSFSKNNQLLHSNITINNLIL